MIKSIVFDIGNVLMRWGYKDWIRTIYDEETANMVTKSLWDRGYWEKLDQGVWKPWNALSAAINYIPEYEPHIREAFGRVGECLERYDYAIPWIRELKELGYRVYYLSNYPRFLRRLRPDVLDFVPETDGGVFSCDVQLLKPDAAIYARLCAEYGLEPEECLFIDDTEKNCEAARRFGMQAIRFENYEISYPKIMGALKRARCGRPIIGVLPLWDEARESLWMVPGYMKGIEEAGGMPIMLPMTEDPLQLDQIADMCDGFLFTGGQDVSPEVYEKPYRVDNIETCPARDRMEEPLLARLLDMDKPILGICRGLQFINGALGGDLYQDLPTEHPSEITHKQGRPYDQPVHAVKLTTGTPLQKLLGKEEMMVNSLHHQAIRETSGALRMMAQSPDHLCEAFYMPGQKFVWGVQWHPEFDYLTNEDSRKIFSAFVDAASMA